MRRAGAGAVLVKGTVAVKPGTVTSVALLGGAGERRELYAFSDAAGSRSAPAGGIRTGAGGTAPSSPGPNAPTDPAEVEAAAQHPRLEAVRPSPPSIRTPLEPRPRCPLSSRPRPWSPWWPGPPAAASRASAVPPVPDPGERSSPPPSPPRSPVALGGCAGAVDSREHPPSGSATLPHRGASQPEVGCRLPGRPAEGFDAPGVAPRAPGFEVGELPERLTASGPGAAPVRLVIPAIGVATAGAPRAGTRRGDGGAQRLRTGRLVRRGPAPGQVGPAVIAGHVDSRTGPAVFYRLRDLRPGDQIRVVRADGSRLRFVVEGRAATPRTASPPTRCSGRSRRALRLITCAGDFDRARGSYRDNLVVFARLAGTG